MNMNVIVGEDEYFGYEMVLIINRNDFLMNRMWFNLLLLSEPNCKYDIF